MNVVHWFDVLKICWTLLSAVRASISRIGIEWRITKDVELSGKYKTKNIQSPDIVLCQLTAFKDGN
jgi:hypothetical protein